MYTRVRSTSIQITSKNKSGVLQSLRFKAHTVLPAYRVPRHDFFCAKGPFACIAASLMSRGTAWVDNPKRRYVATAPRCQHLTRRPRGAPQHLSSGVQFGTSAVSLARPSRECAAAGRLGGGGGAAVRNPKPVLSARWGHGGPRETEESCGWQTQRRSRLAPRPQQLSAMTYRGACASRHRSRSVVC